MIKEIFSRRRILPLLFMIIVILLIRYMNKDKEQQVVLNGETMGTYYNIKYRTIGGINYKESVDSLLIVFNQSLSTYIPTSEISQFNRDSIFYFELPYFYQVLKDTKMIFEATQGAFDPTIMPLVNAWGFGPDKNNLPDSTAVDSLLTLVNFNYIKFDKGKVWKTKKGVQLDFSSIAKGYGVDVVANFLRDKGIENYMVEIGGEVVTHGESAADQNWRIGIETPNQNPEGDQLQAVVQLNDRAMATSGNYKNFYVQDGVKYSHSIDPKSGYPVVHSLLSASVLAKDCASADAYATAFMVMGREKAIELLEKDTTLDAYLIYSDEDGEIKTYTTPGIKALISE